MLHSFLRFQTELTKIVSRFKAPSGIPESGALQLSPAERRQQWMSLQVQRHTHVQTPRFEETWCLIAHWPPWFVTSVWAWTTQLSWPEANQGSKRHAGVTNMELLANFVAYTGIVPPMRQAGARLAALDPVSDGLLLPVIVKDCIMTLMAGIAFLEKVSGHKPLRAVKHHKIRCREVADSWTPRRGLVPRPHLPVEDDTFTLLEDLLHGPSPGEALREFAVHRPKTRYPPGCDLHQRWLAASR